VTFQHNRKFRHASRFHLERNGDNFVIFDTVDPGFEILAPGTTSLQAEQRTAALNIEFDPLRSEPLNQDDRLDLDLIFSGVTPERLAQNDDPRDIGWQYLPSAQDKMLVARWRDWLPQLLDRWARDLIPQLGLHRRWIYQSNLVMRSLERRDVYSFKFLDDDVGAIHFTVWPTTPHRPVDGDDLEMLQLLCLHYLSRDTTAIKAGFFGMHKKKYERQLSEAHALAANRWIS
jgi:hypothetical protein